MRIELHYKIYLMRTLTKLVEIKAFKHCSLDNKNLGGLFAGNKSQIVMFPPSLDTNSWIHVSLQSRDTVHAYINQYFGLNPQLSYSINPSKTNPSITEICQNTANTSASNCRRHRYKSVWEI